jgi:hypothetical protein
MNPEVPWIVFGSLSMLGMGGWLLRPLIVGLGQRVAHRGLDAGAMAELDELRAQVRELDGMQHRVADLEERLDFAERMLAAGVRESERIHGGPP